MKRFSPRADRRGRRRTWPVRSLGTIAVLSLIPGLLAPVAFAADVEPLGKPKLKAPRSVDVSPFTAKVDKKTAAARAKAAAARRADIARAKADQNKKVTWPKAGTATLTVPAAGKAKATPGTLPVTLAPPKPAKGKKAPQSAGAVTVNVLDQNKSAALGVKGIVLTVTGPATGGQAALGINYAAFASAYGGDWAGRLQVLRLPDCALSNPSAAKCRTRTAVEFTNHRRKQDLSTELAFRAAPGTATRSTAARSAGQTMVLALAAGTKSGNGDYKATPLASSSTWEAGGSSGTFTWSYPLRVPPSAAGPKPDLKISYDSGSVDGRTASTNNQGTVIGEGFDITSSYVERKYGSCDDDGQTDKFDLCWKYDNASLVLNGKATELVKDDTTGKWRLKNDDASTVTVATGADNGDDNGEHWTVITGDGTKYVFGLNKLDGAGATDRTNSVWTVPVFGDDAGEPGYADGSTFSGRSKTQAWRWNLDYVEDTHQNAMTYWYTAEQNHYDMLGDDNNGTAYTRGGYLTEIRYGQRAGALFSATPAASNKVAFGYAERCITGDCGSLTDATRDNWPDVPFDAECKADLKCTGNTGPSFYTRKRMTGISTQAWNAAAATPAYESVDSWALTQKYLDPGETGDSTDQSLWLDEIRHTGKRGTDLTLDPVKFSHEFRPNRVDGATDDILSLQKPRLRTITSETGAQTIVTYMAEDCLAGQTMPKVDTNTRRCYPVYWSPNGEKDPLLDWFHKYPVWTVSTSDPQGGAESVEHTYTYAGAAWHYDEDPLVKEKERTWSVWRGFEKVTHLTGRAGETQSKTVAVYLQGMNGDRVLGTDGKTPDPDARKAAQVTGIKAPTITDADQYAGFTRESVTYNGAQEVGGTVNDPWSKRTATQHKSYADTEAYYVRTAGTHTRTNVTTSGTPTDRVRSTATTFDAYGMAETVEDKGDDAVSGDETCTRTWYARNDTLGINSLASRTRTVGKPCATTDALLDLPVDATRPGDVISDTAIAYDTTTWTATQIPTKGEPLWTGRAKGYGADDQPVWQKLATTTYDVLGRPLTAKDTNDTTTAKMTYNPVAAGPLTSSSVENAKLQKTITLVDFATGAALKVTDPNSKVTQSEYDSLGRVTKVWLPNRSKSLGKTPNYVYAYSVTASAPSWVSNGVLKADQIGYNTTYEIYDALLRPRQTQTPSPLGGRLISETLYDERGLAVSALSDNWDQLSGPTGDLVATHGSEAPVQVDTTYDGAGRAITAETKAKNVPLWTIDTAYTGDTVTTTAPAGGQATAVVTNALGQTTQRREYGGTQPTGSDYTTTKFAYTPAGQQASVEGPDQAKWTYTYDLFGRQVSASDPDKGTSTTGYNELDQAISSTDSRPGKSLISEYDILGRQTGLWDGTKTDATKLAAWTFDTLAKGQQDSSVRYENGIGQPTSKAYTQKVTSYDSLYQVTGSQLILPAGDPLVAAGVPQTLSFSTSYNADGTVANSGIPAVAGLPLETVSNTYNEVGQQLTEQGTSQYLQATEYSETGDVRQLTLGMSGTGAKAYHVFKYEPGTRRLTGSYVTDTVHAFKPLDLTFTQDKAGNVTSIFDGDQGGTAKADYQCFTYDGHRRMSEAWTPKTADCSASGRTTANLDGAAPYWTGYTYNAAGQRKSETEHTTSGDRTTNYTYGTPKNQPHPLATTTGAKAATYAYDDAGNTTSRPGTQAQQTLTWNTEGTLVGSSEPAAGTKPALGTSYLYDAAGELLIRRNTTADGDTVLYLGGTEVRLTTKGATKTLTGSRYYTAAGQTIALRTATAGVTGSKLTFLAGDHHGTSSLALDATTMAVTKRYTTPFGAPRGTAPTAWPDDKAFLGKPADTKTGLTHIGAREYDPGIGQFISVDPVLAPDQHQSLNGYAYANNTPVTSADPTGLFCDGCSANADNSAWEPSHGAGCTTEGCYDPSGNISPGTGGDGGTAGQVNDLGDGKPGLPPTEAVKLYWGKNGKNPTVGQMRYWGTYVPGMSYELNAEFYFRERCSYSFDVGCSEFRKYYKGWKHVDKLETVNNCLVCSNVGFELVLAMYGTCTKCFLAGTDVLMANGSTKDIEDVKQGDEVLATDPESGETGKRKVTRLIVTEDDKHFNELTISTQDGPKKLTATNEHPFWSPSEKRWVEAGQLRPGMTLLTVDGSRASVEANRAYSKHARTYNLTVDDLHTYYVLAGETPVLVHNSNCDLPKGYTSSPALKGDPYHPDSVAGRSAQNRELYAGSVGDRAGGLGYRTRIPAQKAPFDSHGQVVFSNGKNYITPDVDGHNVTGGWKMFNRRGQRIGTYDPDLNYLKE
ncbi:polymorphic toxin-type HINT domain-containing protein [Streptomyces sp. NBC_01750]|uniref:polymorphic toxin-type HINT domain-containing protein n=1 Tax=Streptomyces sp. NBC_01750 TaxID=2975928 RepID=UPI002DD84770|nr:polymorphic toxin-type HINT domain-containing protein [Streptomyces sp. NBC_01750]